MNSFLNLSTNAIKTADSLIRHAKEETYDEVEDSIKSLRKNFKAGNYLAISSLLLLTGLAIVLSQIYTGQYFIQSLIYFTMALFDIDNASQEEKLGGKDKYEPRCHKHYFI